MDDGEYGIDWEGPLPEACESGVNVPEINVPITDNELSSLIDAINPLSLSENGGFDLYIATVERIYGNFSEGGIE